MQKAADKYSKSVHGWTDFACEVFTINKRKSTAKFPYALQPVDCLLPFWLITTLRTLRDTKRNAPTFWKTVSLSTLTFVWKSMRPVQRLAAWEPGCYTAIYQSRAHCTSTSLESGCVFHRLIVSNWMWMNESFAGYGLSSTFALGVGCVYHAGVYVTDNLHHTIMQGYLNCYARILHCCCIFHVVAVLSITNFYRIVLSPLSRVWQEPRTWLTWSTRKQTGSSLSNSGKRDAFVLLIDQFASSTWRLLSAASLSLSHYTYIYIYISVSQHQYVYRSRWIIYIALQAKMLQIISCFNAAYVFHRDSTALAEIILVFICLYILSWSCYPKSYHGISNIIGCYTPSENTKQYNVVRYIVLL